MPHPDERNSPHWSADFVEHIRTVHFALKQIDAACGFGSADSMQRAFLRSVGTTPDKYRRQLQNPERCG